MLQTTILHLHIGQLQLGLSLEQEAGFLAIAIKQNETRIGVKDRPRDSRKASPRSDIEYSLASVQAHIGGHCKTIQ